MSIDRPLATALCAALAACGGDGSRGSAGFGLTDTAGVAPAGGAATTDESADPTAAHDASGTSGAVDPVDPEPPDPPGPASTSGVDLGPASTSSVAPYCGDGVVDPGEQCDDGPNNGPHGDCHADCVLDVCGDGDLGPHEECDLGTLNGPEEGCSLACAVLPSACAKQSAQAVQIPRPVDIVVVIDNSGSMIDELDGVQNNINANFAQILEASGLDYRVIMLSRYGTPAGTAICVEAPLGGIPAGGCATPPQAPVNNPGKFYHYSVEIDSNDSWCRILTTLNGAQIDLFKTAPAGWGAWLREGAFKIFIELTDDRVVCDHDGVHYDDHNTIPGGNAAALAFDAALRAADPAHFGAPPAPRNYRYYSITGLDFNEPPQSPYGPDDPLVTDRCPSSVNAGTGYQGLSVLTDALRFPLCDTTSYDAVFAALADGVITDAQVSCDFSVPTPPEGKYIDDGSIEVSVLLEGLDPIALGRVEDPVLCDAMSFFIAGDTLHLCPEACAAAQADGEITVEYACQPIQPK